MARTISRRRRIGTVLLIVVLALIAVRLSLPYVIRSVANKKLANLNGYHGHIGDLSLSLIRGAYRVDSLVFSKKDSATLDTTPFVRAKSMEFSIEWKSLLKGNLVAEIDVESPELRFTKEKAEPKSIVKDSAYLKSLADLAMPLSINRFGINNGRLRYIDPKLGVDVSLEQIQATALNLKNAYDSTSAFPASLSVSAVAYDGQLSVEAELNPLKLDPTFRMNAELTEVNLPQLNDFFNAYAKIDVAAGRFGLFTEAEAKDG